MICSLFRPGFEGTELQNLEWRQYPKRPANKECISELNRCFDPTHWKESNLGLTSVSWREPALFDCWLCTQSSTCWSMQMSVLNNCTSEGKYNSFYLGRTFCHFRIRKCLLHYSSFWAFATWSHLHRRAPVMTVKWDFPYVMEEIC